MTALVDVPKEMAKLKDFQRATVEHVFRRLYSDPDATRRFLVADEVGLGKTMVARGVIARAIEHLESSIERIDVVYVCSNAAIAHQNLNRLKVLDRDLTFATRLTLLPKQVGQLKGNKVNFVSFTPGTTFDLKSRSGVAEERVLLYRMLRERMPDDDTALRNLLQATVGTDSWHRQCAEDVVFDAAIGKQFHGQLRKDGQLRPLTQLLEHFRRRRDSYDDEVSSQRYQMIGTLRQTLAKVCVEALEPDLIILDEFQRFKDLLDGDSEAAELARLLFDYPDARVLLLSATPYRMLTLGHERDEDHHADFLRTARFLLGGDEPVHELQRELASFRHGLLGDGAEALERTVHARDAVETRLRKVMCRTERVQSTKHLDSMVKERVLEAPLHRVDVRQAIVADRAAQLVDAGDTIEYWKSAPYLLHLMRDYDLRRKLDQKKNRLPESLVEHLHDSRADLLRAKQLSRYQAVDPANARLRALTAETLDHGAWRLLWLPPSMPYVEPGGTYADLGPGALTKQLVFSSWNLVPDALSTLLSYEAERRMLGGLTASVRYDNLSRQRRPLLRFNSTRDRGPQGMPALALLYPCATLARFVDPFHLALELGGGEPLRRDAMQENVEKRLLPCVKKVVERFADPALPEDTRWHWAILPLLDSVYAADAVVWAGAAEGLRAIAHGDEENEAGEGDELDGAKGFEKHVELLLRVARGEERLGSPPEDLMSVVLQFALASPAVCASRAIRRVARLAQESDPNVMSAAARIAWGFRVLFNVPETIAMVLGGDTDEPYWRRVLDYCADGNLQAVLDEYAHVLVPSEGLVDETGAKVADSLSRRMLEALSPRTATVSLHELKLDRANASLSFEEFRVRCRYALRFGEFRDDADKSLARADTVRAAFNSPFRPFLLASTSIGQEGLDFHTYCHRLYHWNLPTNPVDLEQREGRVHRFKGHAVRRNVARAFGLRALKDKWDGDADPWKTMFDLAVASRPPGECDLVPYWLYEVEGGEAVERVLPILPMSKEVERFQRLKKMLALYRLAFGQPRQEDLLAYLASRGSSGVDVEGLRIDLRPRADHA